MPYSLHPYQYAYSNPVRWTDPSGKVAPVCGLGYLPVHGEEGEFLGCTEIPNFPEWLSSLKGTVILPGPGGLVGGGVGGQVGASVSGSAIGGAVGRAGGPSLPQLGRESVNACANLIGGILIWAATRTDIQTRSRRDLPVLKISRSRMPRIAAHIEDAQTRRYPGVLTYAPQMQRINRAIACGGFVPTHGGTCDEYPFAVTMEGGLGASIAEVPLQEQRRQGGTISSFVRRHKLLPGNQFLVLVVP